MTLFRRSNRQEPIGDVEGTNEDGFFAIPFGTVQRVGPYTNQQGAQEFLARDAGCSSEFYIEAGGPFQIQ